MKKFLIVDDQVLYLKSLKALFSKNYKVVTASSYDEAIEQLQNPVDIALIDIRLDEDDENNADGLKLLKWIQQNSPSISCFTMSAYTDFGYTEKALSSGARYFFRKPIDIKTLTDIIKEKG